ncbi:hypothetical protein TDMWS_21530 [Thermodesulfomicrobium sp. WS]|nr:hypothetical protein TDMWS_21530 [Thermodesulfomicrobium sp. WS]
MVSWPREAAQKAALMLLPPETIGVAVALGVVQTLMVEEKGR